MQISTLIQSDPHHVYDPSAAPRCRCNIWMAPGKEGTISGFNSQIPLKGVFFLSRRRCCRRRRGAYGRGGPRALTAEGDRGRSVRRSNV